MKLKTISAFTRREPREIVLASLPSEILIAHFARDKTLAINELIRTVHGDSLEWYGYTLGEKAKPDLVLDVGLPRNGQNGPDYTALTPQMIQKYQESLPASLFYGAGGIRQRE
jgi:hypothetical protein